MIVATNMCAIDDEPAAYPAKHVPIGGVLQKGPRCVRHSAIPDPVGGRQCVDSGNI